MELEGAASKDGGVSPVKTSAASKSLGEIATVRIELKDTDPPIWRQVEAPTSITLKVLHDIIQATIGWFDYHLWEFTIGKQRYGLPMEEGWGAGPPEDCGASPASTNCSKPEPTPITPTMPRSGNGSTTTIPTSSTNCRSSTLSAGSQVAETPPRRASTKAHEHPRPIHRQAVAALTGWIRIRTTPNPRTAPCCADCRAAYEHARLSRKHASQPDPPTQHRLVQTRFRRHGACRKITARDPINFGNLSLTPVRSPAPHLPHPLGG